MKKKTCVIFLRRNCNYSNNFLDFCKKKLVIHKVFYDDIKSLTPFKIVDYIFCFRSKKILSKAILKKANFASINFHPGTPKYRGVGCVNYALYNNETIYGTTAHLINEKIDSGKILDVQIFKINKDQDIETVLNKTYKLMLFQAKKIITQLIKKPSSVNNFQTKYTWSKIIKKRKDLEKFYEINIKSNKKEFLKKIRATKTKNFKPFIKLFGLKFILKD